MVTTAWGLHWGLRESSHNGSEKLLLREVFTSVQDSGSLSRYIRTYVFVRFSSPCSHREMYPPELNSLIMENGFFDKVEDNAAVRIWAETIQQEKGDSLTKGYVSELWDFTRIDERLFRALVQYWNSAYSCFTFGKVDLVPTIEEYTVLIRCPKIQKGGYRCILWNNLRDLILAHPDTKKRVDVFTLSIYGFVIFPKALGHIDEAVSDLFDRLSKGTTHVPAILAKTFRSLNACRRAGEGRFIGCAQLLLSWFHSHFWKVEKISYRIFSENYSPLKELVATPRRDDITEEN
ncbi:hypothetical protein CXB51_000157 [Gossypium anomalum]|uniref:DUF7745 domain-containing protein n=1 Tax=Gossypium anomalum TaxID=47600 RepID=A0A8J6DCS6_9ROSI|nr:hypothetical protein CXB51_000157 [Gossypium anomalum]